MIERETERPDSNIASSPTTEANEPLTRLERQLVEALDSIWDNAVDPAEALYDVDGSRWAPLGDDARGGDAAGVAFTNEQQLREIRSQCRALAVNNEFAINGHENRISFIVGPGHSYRAASKRGEQAGDELIGEVQTVLDEFVRINKWQKRQQEVQRRLDRDGEAFLRFFPAPDGITRIRFVEPSQISTPPERAGDPAASFGIQTAPDDVETVLGYYLDGRWVDADQIQHRKANVDANVKRGLPLFYAVRKNLRRVEKLLRNMSVVAEIQSAIALIRKHNAATKGSVQQFIADRASATTTSPSTGKTNYFQRYAPGTILDTFGGLDYQFPAATVDASRYVAVLQAELRAIASRLVMPEFMLTSDASNANYASTMVAEGPAVRMFQRLQHDLLEDDRELMRRVLVGAVGAGRLAREALERVEIQAVAPSLAVRDRLKEAQADQILLRNGVMSVQTMAVRHGLDPDKEQSLLGVAKKAH